MRRPTGLPVPRRVGGCVASSGPASQSCGAGPADGGLWWWRLRRWAELRAASGRRPSPRLMFGLLCVLFMNQRPCGATSHPLAPSAASSTGCLRPAASGHARTVVRIAKVCVTTESHVNLPRHPHTPCEHAKGDPLVRCPSAGTYERCILVSGARRGCDDVAREGKTNVVRLTQRSAASCDATSALGPCRRCRVLFGGHDRCINDTTE